MKGADQCPKCASRSWAEPRVESEFYAIDVRVCRNCQTIWEPFDEADLPHGKAEPLGAFKHPCNNCAFRKGSPEQSDPEGFAELRSKLGWFGASFYCHKGIAIDIHNDDGFAYPRDAEGKPIVRKLRLCRGYLNQLGKFPLDKEYEALLDAQREPAE